MIQPLHTPPAEPPPRLLVVETDPAIRDRLIAAFTLDGYDAVAAADFEDARTCLASGAWDLVLLQVAPPDESGYRLLRDLRTGVTATAAETGTTLPVMMISNRGAEHDRIKGFELGCDDWITKPYSFGELRGRVAAVLRRSRPATRNTTRDLGELVINTAERTVTLADRTINLTSKEYALLDVLASEPARVFERGVLMRKLYGTTAPGSTRTLDAQACRLRAKLAGGSNHYVVNVWGVGYRLTAQPAATS
ncbi:MAG: response regulator transcription factor [Thermoleophilaceae bacterium]|nr:response regulator transcription factor [Thermoleophilaceae bacterium]